MKKSLYFECETGISGDMTVAALIDLGADREALDRALKSLAVTGFSVKISRVKKAGLDLCDFAVILDAAHENHDHDMHYLFGEETAAKPHHAPDDGQHHHGHRASDEPQHHHEHRGLKEILAIIDRAAMTDGAKALAGKIFDIIAAAESIAHGVPREEVHFHEVGAVDSIVDVVAAAVCLDSLGVTDCIIPRLVEGTGSIRCQHGMLPVPVPAVLNIVKAHGLTLSVTERRGELVTPTGAAIAAAVKTADRLPPSFRVLAVGLGAGKRAYQRPSFLRAMLIEETASADVATDDTVWVLETNIDDATGEMLGFAAEKLMAAGARDVFFQPIFMKKNRPAYLLTVISAEEKRRELERIIFRETTTIGIRRQKMARALLARETVNVATPWGDVAVKKSSGDGVCRTMPEYESVAKIARETDRPFGQIYNLARQLAEADIEL